jgi:predicted transcriptional regulator
MLLISRVASEASTDTVIVASFSDAIEAIWIGHGHPASPLTKSGLHLNRRLDIAQMTPKERLDLIDDSLSAADITDLDWAKPFVEEALAEIERGEVVSLAEHDTEIDALMHKLGA